MSDTDATDDEAPYLHPSTPPTHVFSNSSDGMGDSFDGTVLVDEGGSSASSVVPNFDSASTASTVFSSQPHLPTQSNVSEFIQTPHRRTFQQTGTPGGEKGAAQHARMRIRRGLSAPKRGRRRSGKNSTKKVRKPMYGKKRKKNFMRGLHFNRGFKLYEDDDSGNEADEDEPFTTTSEPPDNKGKKGSGPGPSGAGAGMMQTDGGRRRRKTKRRRRSRKKRTKRRTRKRRKKGTKRRKKRTKKRNN